MYRDNIVYEFFHGIHRFADLGELTFLFMVTRYLTESLLLIILLFELTATVCKIFKRNYFWLKVHDAKKDIRAGILYLLCLMLLGLHVLGAVYPMFVNPQCYF